MSYLMVIDEDADTTFLLKYDYDLNPTCYAVDSKTGDIKWSIENARGVIAAGDKFIFWTKILNGETLHIIDRETGKESWSETESFTSDIGGLLFSEGTFLVMTSDNISAFR